MARNLWPSHDAAAVTGFGCVCGCWLVGCSCGCGCCCGCGCGALRRSGITRARPLFFWGVSGTILAISGILCQIKKHDSHMMISAGLIILKSSSRLDPPRPSETQKRSWRVISRKSTLQPPLLTSPRIVGNNVGLHYRREFT